MLLVQAGIGAAAWSKLVPLAIVVAVLLVIVVLSYRQTIYAYPSGGGSYVVSRENLGETPSLVAGASLLTDYILTVAVSVAGGVLAIQSAFGFDSEWRVPICLRADRRDDGGQPARAEGVGGAVRPADLPLHRHADAADRASAATASSSSTSARSRSTTCRRRRQELAKGTKSLEHPDAAAGVLVGRRRAVRRRGGVQRRAGVPQAGEPQRGDDDRHHGRHPRHLLPRRVGPRLPPPPVPRRARTRPASP